MRGNASAAVDADWDVFVFHGCPPAKEVADEVSASALGGLGQAGEGCKGFVRQDDVETVRV